MDGRGWEVGDRGAGRKRIRGRKISILNKKGGNFGRRWEVGERGVGDGRKGGGRWERVTLLSTSS